MKTSTLFIRFNTITKRINKKGLIAIQCRITFNKKRKDFATGLFVDPKDWDSKKQKLLDSSEQEETINMQLSLIKNKLSKAFLVLQIKEVPFTVNDIYNLFQGKSLVKNMGIIEVYNLHNERMERLIGKEIVQVTYDKYLESLKHLKDFIKHQYKTSDKPLRVLKMGFINDYTFFLKSEKNMQLSTLNKAIQRLRKVVKFAIGHDYLDKDPFLLYKAKTVKKEIVFLSKEELSKLEDHVFKIKRLQVIKDCFVFCCYTGLAFKEMSNLRKSNIVTEYDGQSWIKMKRQKTNKSLSIPILPKAQQILDIYTSDEDERILPNISNQRFNAYLKEIADVTGIEKNLTHHIARKTFATTVLLYNDVPMEVVSELLGHSKMATTQQSYGKIVQRKVGEEMRRLREG